jgi:hypothetical protein
MRPRITMLARGVRDSNAKRGSLGMVSFRDNM